MFRRSLILACLLAPSLSVSFAHAFCGFYVAKADASLFNDASKVVVARHDNKSVVTMLNDYRGEPSEFAMVVPVPSVLKRGQIHLGNKKTAERLDAYTAPRLVEYFDSDPCVPVHMLMERSAFTSKVRLADDTGGAARTKSLGVKIEAQYAVGEYDITILSGKESSGLLTWLKEEGYKVPDKAEKTLASYIKQGLYFFLAKINLERKEQDGSVFLRPIQIAFESPKFGLPIRLGTVNSEGLQDLIVYTLTQKGRVEPVNYRMTELPSGQELPGFVKEEFGELYKDIFATAAKREDYRTVFLEYAWNMNWCDPCAADPLSSEELRELGAFWVPPASKAAPAAPNIPRRFRSRGGAAPQVYVTRMHLRYDDERFPEDLRFQETENRANFQGRYVIRHAWKGEATCDAGKEYRKKLEERRHKEARTLAHLTGRDLSDIHKKMAETYGDFNPKNADDRPWYEKLWGGVQKNGKEGK